jgi:hypothetical protein
LNQVAEGLYNIVIAAFEATIDAINSEINNTFHKYSNEEASKVEAIVEGINSGRIPEDKILPSLIKAIHLYPYNRDIYILFLSNFGDHDRSLEAVMNYFGIASLSNEKKKIFELKRSKFSLTSLEDCQANLPILEDYAKSIGYEEFQEESKKLLETAKKQEFEKRLGSTDFSTISACKINLPILQEFANQIGYNGFEKDSIDILNRAIESDFLLEASKYDLKSIKSYEANVPKLKSFAADIGFQKFDEWATQIQTKAKPKTTAVVLGYLAILIIGSLIFNEQVGAMGFILCSFLFILGLISPKLVLWWGGEQTRFRVMKIYGLLILLSFIVLGMFVS